MRRTSSRARWAGAAVLLATLAPAVVAHATTTPRVQVARAIAEYRWGPVCGGSYTIRHGPLPRPFTAWAQMRSQTEDGLPPYTDCSVTFRRGVRLDWPALCSTLVHEVAHLSGWRAPLGQEYVGPDGRHDFAHSASPSSVLYPLITARYWRCDTRRPVWPPSRAAAHPVPTTPTVLLLHGGGWSTGAPAQMDAWVREFRDAGYVARSVAYPLHGNVLEAIDAVRTVAARESAPVVLYGYSAGGTIAAALAATGDVAGAVNVVGPSNLAAWPAAGLFLARMTVAQKIAASPYHRLAGRQAPTLLQCGAVDPLVTVDQCTSYRRKAGPVVTLQLMADQHHQDARARWRALEWVRSRFPAG